MLQNILNLDGVTVLNKKQQNSVNGGMMASDSDCKFTVISGGSRKSETFDVGVSGSGASSAANSWCVSIIESGDADRCFYDCEWDN